MIFPRWLTTLEAQATHIDITYINFSCIVNVQRMNDIRKQFTDQMICATFKGANETADTCVGDSGGPLVRKVDLSFIKQYMYFRLFVRCILSQYIQWFANNIV